MRARAKARARRLRRLRALQQHADGTSRVGITPLRSSAPAEGGNDQQTFEAQRGEIMRIMRQYSLRDDVLTLTELVRTRLLLNKQHTDFRYAARIHFSDAWGLVVREKWGWMPTQSEFKIYRAELLRDGSDVLFGYGRIDNSWEFQKLKDAISIWEKSTNQNFDFTVPLLFVHTEEDDVTDYWRLFTVTPYYRRKAIEQLDYWLARSELDFLRIVNLLLDISMAVADYHLKEDFDELVMLNFIRPNSFVFDEQRQTFLLHDMTPALEVEKYVRSLGKSELHMQQLRGELDFRYVASEIYHFTGHGDVDPLKFDDWQVAVTFWDILKYCYRLPSGIARTQSDRERRLLIQEGMPRQHFSQLIARPHPLLCALVQRMTSRNPKDRLEIWQVIDLLCLLSGRDHPFGPFPYEPVSLEVLTQQFRQDDLVWQQNFADDSERVRCERGAVNAEEVNAIYRVIMNRKATALSDESSAGGGDLLLGDSTGKENDVDSTLAQTTPTVVSDYLQIVTVLATNDDASDFCGCLPLADFYWGIPEELDDASTKGQVLPATQAIRFAAPCLISSTDDCSVTTTWSRCLARLSVSGLLELAHLSSDTSTSRRRQMQSEWRETTHHSSCSSAKQHPWECFRAKTTTSLFCSFPTRFTLYDAAIPIKLAHRLDAEQRCDGRLQRWLRPARSYRSATDLIIYERTLDEATSTSIEPKPIENFNGDYFWLRFSDTVTRNVFIRAVAAVKNPISSLDAAFSTPTEDFGKIAAMTHWSILLPSILITPVW